MQAAAQSSESNRIGITRWTSSGKRKGKKRYVCSFEGCHKEFAESGNLRTHLRIHVSETHVISNTDGGTTLSLRLFGVHQSVHHQRSSEESSPDSYGRKAQRLHHLREEVLPVGALTDS
jgi:hypothetical protein